MRVCGFTKLMQSSAVAGYMIHHVATMTAGVGPGQHPEDTELLTP